jgi:hypothetical protein
MACRRCAGCGGVFKASRRVPDQRYCSSPACQRTRGRLWRQQKLKDDADYRLNQAKARRAWAKDHADYWRGYRAAHPDYAEQNRVEQRRRDGRRRSERLAKIDAISGDLPVRSGTYRILPASGADLAKIDAITVKIKVLSIDCAERPEDGPILQRDHSIGSPGPLC